MEAIVPVSAWPAANGVAVAIEALFSTSAWVPSVLSGSSYQSTVSFQVTYTRPRWGPVERSTAIDGKITPWSRLNPGDPGPKFVNTLGISVSEPNEAPALVDLRIVMKATAVSPYSVQVPATSPSG